MINRFDYEELMKVIIKSVFGIVCWTLPIWLILTYWIASGKNPADIPLVGLSIAINLGLMAVGWGKFIEWEPTDFPTDTGSVTVGQFTMAEGGKAVFWNHQEKGLQMAPKQVEPESD